MNLKSSFVTVLTLAGLAMSASVMADVFVDLNHGDDRNDGSRKAPLRSFAVAVNKAVPGDTVFILPSDKPINATLIIKNKKGLPDKPVVIDGMMNTLVGTRPASEKDWTEADPGTGLYHRQLSRPPTGNRYFMRFNGRMERMERHTKWKGAELKKPEELKNYEWTIVGEKDFYFKIRAGEKIAAAGVEEPYYCNGVEISGECAYLVVRNLIVRQFWNDGYNIHFNCHDILFENVAALENSDDGISAHETCKIKVKNMVSIGNGTGFCHIQQSECDHENIYIAASDSRDIYLLNSVNRLKNVIVEGSAPGDMDFRTGNEFLTDCLFLNLRPGVQLLFLQCQTRAERVSFAGYAAGKGLPSGIIAAGDPELFRRDIAASRQKIMDIFDGKLNFKYEPNGKVMLNLTLVNGGVAPVQEAGKL